MYIFVKKIKKYIQCMWPATWSYGSSGILFSVNIRALLFYASFSLTSLLMTNSLTVVAKVFSNTLIVLQKKCE